MYPPSIVLCFAFLLVASFSEFQEDFTDGDEQSDNSTVQFDSLVNSTKYRNEGMELTRCNSHENSIKNNEMQYESCINSTNNNCKNDSVRYESREHMIKNHKDNNQTSMEFCTNSTEINNFTLQEINENLTKTEDKKNFVSYTLYDSNRIVKTTYVEYEECNDNITCIQLCCPVGYNLTVKGRCINHGEDDYVLPNMYTLSNKHGNDSEDETLDEIFFTVRDPCVAKEHGREFVFANTYLFLTNGSLYMSTGGIISPKSYCFAILFRNVYDVIICNNQTKLPVYISVCLLLSLPFLLLTFIIYSILPELQNMHGYTLRAHVGSLFITYAIMYFGQQVSGLAEEKYCVALAYIFNFFFLSSFFWLNVTCFDIWWTFRELRSHRKGGGAKYDKKKLIIYSIYAWGITIILNVICAIMDNIPNPPENLVRPEICEKRFWYGENKAKTLYFYVPMGATIISNIFFFICTTLTILYQKIHTASQMRDSESKRHDENKQRFSMYLKLFIVMGITWVLEIISWAIDANIVPQFIWYPSDIINSLQGLIIFVIFVCRKKIKKMLLKRFGGKTCGPFKIPISDSVASNTTTSTTTTGSGTISMQQISPSN